MSLAEARADGAALVTADLRSDAADPALAALESLGIATADIALVRLDTIAINSSVPGGLKNAVDWLSRPSLAESVLRGKPVAVVGASTGAFGAVWAQAELRKVLAATGARVVEGEAVVGHAIDRFDTAGRLNDTGLKEQLREVTDALLLEAQSKGTGKLAA